jgi:type IV secretion system protein VirB4
MRPLAEVRTKEAGFADYLLYDCMIAPGVLFGKDASFTAGWYFRGADLASSTVEELQTVSARLNLALRALSGGWMIHCDLVRRTSPGYPARGAFRDRTTLVMDEERRQQFTREGAHYESSYAIFLTHLPPKSQEAKVAAFMIEGEEKTDRTSHAPKTLEAFKKAATDFEETVTSVLNLQRMVDTEQEDGQGGKNIFSELLAYLHFAATGEYHPMVLPKNLMYLDSMIGNADYVGGFKPRVGDKHMRVVTLDGFPQESYPGMLAALDDLSISYRWTTRFIFLDHEKAKQEIDSVRKKWKQKIRGFMDQLLGRQNGAINYDAADMEADANGAMSEAESGDVRFGRYTSTVVLFGADPERLDNEEREVRKLFQGRGFAARSEGANATEAFLGSLPADGYRNIRRQMLHTMNLADLLPTTAVWAGLAKNPCPFYPPDSPPLMMAATTGHTPFRISLHVGDVGHTLILGPTGSGKSTLLTFLVAQHFRYPRAQVFAFDKGYSMYGLCKASGGEHYDIAGEKTKLAFCPLRAIDSDADLLWAVEWVEALVLLSRGSEASSVSAQERNMLTQAMMMLRESNTRTITEYSANVQDQNLKAALQHYTISGPMGTLLDADTDSLGTNRFMVFEMEHLMSLGDKAVVPVLLYLFRAIEKRLDGSPTLIPLDEAWIMLSHPVFRERIREWLKVMRKANAAVIPATQSLDDIFNSPIRDVLLESCPTKILLPNPVAKDKASAEKYEYMGLNYRQISIIAESEPKKHYYYLSPKGRRLFEFGFGKVALSFIGASGKEDVAAIEALSAQHGETWPAEWLRRRGLNEWADYWLKVG